jgi:hypothetical protein
VESFNIADRCNLLAILEKGDRSDWRYDLSKAASVGQYDELGNWVELDPQPEYARQVIAIKVSLANGAALAFLDTAVADMALRGVKRQKKIAIKIIREELARAKRIARRHAAAFGAMNSA